jgi:hypothetical protein
VLLLLGLLLGGQESSATPEIPETARSAAVLTPSILLDDPVNAYIFPQLAPTLASALRAFAASGRDAEGSGAVVKTGPHALHYFQHEWEPSQVELSWRSVPLYRAGWGVQLGRLRFGLSYAWSAEAQEQGRGRRQLYPDGAQKGLSTESWFSSIDYRRGAVGIGWSEGEASFDLVFGLAREQLDTDWSLRQESVHDLSLRTRTASSDLRISSEWCPDFALRFQVPVGDEALVRAFAAFREVADSVAAAWSATSGQDGVVESHEELKYDDSPSGQSWSCGILFTSRAPRSSRWAVHASYRNERGPLQYRAGRGACCFEELTRQQSREDAGEFGLSLAVPLRWSLELRSGAIVRAARTILLRERIRYEVIRTSDLNTDESLSHAFAWGLARDFGALELTGSLRKTLDPADPFALLDIGIRF